MSKIYVDEIAGIASADTVAIPGHVIQVVQGNLNELTTASATKSSIGSLSITLASASNKVLVQFSNHVYVGSYATNDWRAGLIQLKRGSTVLLDEADSTYGEGFFLTDDDDRYMTYSSHTYLDSPNTAGAVTYEVLGASKAGLTTVRYNISGYGLGGNITLMEIAG